MPEERKNEDLKDLQDMIYGDRTASEPKQRDGLVRRVEDVETKQQEVDPIVPYVKLFGTSIKYLGLPGALGLIYAVFRYLSQGGAP